MRRGLSILVPAVLLSALTGFAGQRAFLGVGLQQREDGGPGVLVYALYPGGPAERAGLRPGDLIVGIDGAPASPTTEVEVIDLFAAYAPGDKIVLRVERDATTRELEVEAEETPAEILRHQRLVRDQPADTKGFEDLMRLLELASEFRVRRPSDGELMIDFGESFETSLAMREELIEVLGRLHPVGGALRDLEVGGSFRFTASLDPGTHRLSLALVDETAAEGDQR